MGRFIELLRTDPGFQADHLLASVVLPSADRYRTPEQRGLIYRRFVDAVRALPGVESVGTVDALPFSGENHGGLVASTAAQVMQPNTQVPAEVDIVSAGYLQTLGVRLLEGRWLREDEMKTSSDTVLVNDVAAAKFWPGTSAIGKQICIYCTPENPRNWKRVVGVVTSVRHAAIDEHRPFSLYLAAGAMEHAQFIVANTAQPADSLEQAVRIAIAGVDPNQPVFLSVSMRSLIADSLADRRFIASLLAVTAFLALVMSAAGVYGVVLLTPPRAEHWRFCVRMALGATRNHVQFLVFRQGFLAVAAGLAIGLAATMGLMSVLRRFVVGLGAAHWLQILVLVSIVSFAAAIACWVPGRRADEDRPDVPHCGLERHLRSIGRPVGEK